MRAPEWIFGIAEGFLQGIAAINDTAIRADLTFHMLHERLSLRGRHGATARIILPIQRIERFIIDPDHVQKIMGLSDRIFSGGKMIGTPTEAVIIARRTVMQITIILVISPLGRLVDDANDASVDNLRPARHLIPM